MVNLREQIKNMALKEIRAGSNLLELAYSLEEDADYFNNQHDLFETKQEERRFYLSDINFDMPGQEEFIWKRLFEKSSNNSEE